MIFKRFIDFNLFGRHKLESVKLLPLGASLLDAKNLYGKPLSSERTEETSEIIEHSFTAGDYHELVAYEWKGKIQSITYWSEKSDPKPDLQYMLGQYGAASDWSIMEEGYWYQRNDRKVRLWCSAAPAIGVAFVDFLRAKAEFKRKYEFEKIEKLDDPRWAPNDAVFELQKRFVIQGDHSVLDFVARSDDIVMSPDGKDLFIVRDHHAYDVPDGFMELNMPPKKDKGYSTAVINFFSWSEDGSSWGKATLPSDATVESILFDGDVCHLHIRRVSTGQTFEFKGRSKSISSLAGISFSVSHQNEDLWDNLTKKELELNGSGDVD